jgi:hypothetical protein
MILGPMLISLLSGLAAAVGWVLTGGSIWVAISIVYGLAATAGLLVSASLMALRSPAASDRLAAPRHGYHPPPREAARRKRRVVAYVRAPSAAVAVRVNAKATRAVGDWRI